MSNKCKKLHIIDIMNTPEKRQKGLMYSKPLKKDECVLFIFPYNDDYSFWNKNVFFPLSLAFIDENGKILAIKHMKANDPTTVKANSSEVRYVIEANKGIFDELDINIDDYCVFDKKQVIFHKNIFKNKGNT